MPVSILLTHGTKISPGIHRMALVVCGGVLGRTSETKARMHAHSAFIVFFCFFQDSEIKYPERVYIDRKIAYLAATTE